MAKQSLGIDSTMIQRVPGWGKSYKDIVVLLRALGLDAAQVIAVDPEVEYRAIAKDGGISHG